LRDGGCQAPLKRTRAATWQTLYFGDTRLRAIVPTARKSVDFSGNSAGVPAARGLAF
jgi:hypothetical protein